MPRKGDPDAQSERERRRLMEEEREIGRNLPDEFHGVEGADVREVVRHPHGDEEPEEEEGG